MKKILRKIRNTIERYEMLSNGDRVIVAVSGGPDSVCLLDILSELKETLKVDLVVAHYDHGLRSGESEGETRFVETLAETLKLPFETEKTNLLQNEKHGSLEENARRLRYQFLNKVRDKFNAQKIATGHNLNDQAETVLMRLLRGSGPLGLSGIIPFRRDGVIRPLIEVPREEIELYLSKKGISFITDPSNLETRFFRNQIRHEIIPFLEQYQGPIIKILGHTAETMRADELCLGKMAEDWMEENAQIKKGSIVKIPLPALLSLPTGLRNRIIRGAIINLGGSLRRLTKRHLEAINNIASGDRSQAILNLPNRILVRKIYNEMAFEINRGEVITDYSFSLRKPGKYPIGTTQYSISIEELRGDLLPLEKGDSQTAHICGDKIDFPLVVRNFRPGDKFVPLGMKGHKKVKDLFIDLKIPAHIRNQIPIVTHKGQLVWICGLRIDDRYKLLPTTKKALELTLTMHKK